MLVGALSRLRCFAKTGGGVAMSYDYGINAVQCMCLKVHCTVDYCMYNVLDGYQWYELL